MTIAVTPVLGQVGDYEVTSGSTLSVGAPGVLGAAVGSGLQASLVSDVADGSLTLNEDGSFSYTPAPGFSGTDSFTLGAVDGAGQDAGTETVTIIVDPASSPPVVPQPPSVIAQDFYGAVGNTELQVGGTRGTGPEVYHPAPARWRATATRAGARSARRRGRSGRRRAAASRSRPTARSPTSQRSASAAPATASATRSTPARGRARRRAPRSTSTPRTSGMSTTLPRRAETAARRRRSTRSRR